MAQATQPPAESLIGAVRALEEAINGLRHSQNILVAAMGIVAALFLGALVWLASDVSALRQQVVAVEARIETSAVAINSRIDNLNTRMETGVDAINSRIDSLNTRVDDLVAAVGEVRAAIGAINTKLDEISRSTQNRAELDVERPRSGDGAEGPESPGAGPGR
ncbi:MAG: hypothetical protein ACREIR_04855 [Geminicoccaceae bacterium]